MVDNAIMDVRSLASNSSRFVSIKVAGPAALVVAKLIKIGERPELNRPLDNKDAFDIFRLLKAGEVNQICAKLHELLAHPLCKEVAVQALKILDSEFAKSRNSS